MCWISYLCHLCKSEESTCPFVVLQSSQRPLTYGIFVRGEPVYCSCKATVHVFKPTPLNLFHDT